MTREEAIERMEMLRQQHEGALLTTQAIDMAIEALHFAEHFDLLKEFQSLQEVVRCKDCRWYDNSDVCHNPRYGDGHANYQPPYVDEDYWCKDGEREGGDTE